MTTQAHPPTSEFSRGTICGGWTFYGSRYFSDTRDNENIWTRDGKKYVFADNEPREVEMDPKTNIYWRFKK